MSAPNGFLSWRSICVIALIVVLTLAWVFRASFLTAAANSLVEDDGPARMQAAVVLGGDYTCSRILKAASLAQAGYAPFVLVSGPQAFGRHESDITVNCAERMGYSTDLFRPFPNDFTSTREEASGIGEYLRSHGINRILLVTSNYHTHRAAHLFRRENPDMIVRVIPAPDPSFTPSSWWQSREGRKTFLLEWIKTATEWFGA